MWFESSAAPQQPYSIRRPAGDRLDRERWVRPAHRREHRAVADPEVRNVPTAAVGVDDALVRIGAHPGCSVEMAGVVVLDPEILGIDSLQRASHEFQRMIDQPL